MVPAVAELVTRIINRIELTAVAIFIIANRPARYEHRPLPSNCHHVDGRYRELEQNRDNAGMPVMSSV
jgi:hypothetical protein